MHLNIAIAICSLVLLAENAVAESAAIPPFGSNLEVRRETSYGYEMSGNYDGIAYSYGMSESGAVINGAIDGPRQGVWTIDDPDRWVITVDRDQITDAVTWRIHHYQTGLMLTMTKSGQIAATCIVGSDFPNRTARLRVGKAKAFSLFDGCSTTIGPQLKELLLIGGALTVRKFEWPHDYPKDEVGIADNFNKTLKLLNFLRSKNRDK